LDYPADRLEVIIVSDGSTDDTNRILRDHASERVRPYVLPQHEGKATALNRGIQEARGEVVVFTDARQTIERAAISRLVAHYADPRVGCVSGELMLTNPGPQAGGTGAGLYWKIEKQIRLWEGIAGSVVGATGALYAVRRDLIVPLPPGTVLDDVYIPLHVVRSGARVVFEPSARAWDTVSGNLRQEFRRKVRTLTGNYQLLQLAPWVLSPANPVRFEFVSHKLLRLVVPFALAGMLIGALAQQGRLYLLIGLLQLVFYGLGLMALPRPKIGVLSRIGDVALTFILLNAAAAMAFFNFVTGRKAVWAR
jgi:cellulose synthase/poly-beta-1,6-N-acetylglucosamine synthase-like glycosyltransferase